MMRGEIPSRHRQAFNQRRLAKNPNLQRKLEQMALPLAPLVQLTTGAVHPSFPTTVLNFWLLTDEQLESLAHFYHQRTPSPWTNQYPCPITWRSDLPLEEKRRKMGKFIGLRGCESSILLKSEEEILADARKARFAAEEDLWRRKHFS
ncbi:beta-xylosidase [Fusarium austroafricanum]|uniref:Beta-xylosidase n=1 Tax=Fusarium austroafricanum TaxID=2364996 RepID=A0A8H4KPJ6_9HYPO|nr:beta-xylosidase [Fusarium austroafricanum]